MWSELFVVLLCGYTYSYAMTDAQAKAKFIKILMICTKDVPVEMSDLLNLQNLVSPTKKEVKCLLACTYREIGTLDSKGMYNITKGYEIAELMKEGDDKRVENARKLCDICVEVNNAKVTDGEKGCERSGMLFDCVTKHAPKLGFEIK